MLDVNKESEELQMLLEVSEKVAAARAGAREKGRDLSPSEKRKISGAITENVIRVHLLKKNFNLSMPCAYISPSPIEIDLLLLKPEIDPTKRIYLPSEVVMVLEIKNIAVADQTTRTRANFGRLKEIAPDLQFAFVVLSQRITYIHRVTTKRLGYPVFELILRRRPAGRWLESKNEIMFEYRKIMRNGERAMWETDDWKKLIDYLSSKTSSNYSQSRSLAVV